MERKKEIDQLEQKKILLSLVHEVAKEENFQLEVLASEYEKYFIPLNGTTGDRCVDGRRVLESYSDGSPTGYSKANFNGPQFPGGTLGLIDALKLTTDLDEDAARELLAQAYTEGGIRMGAHIDDEHSELQTQEGLAARKAGCGNQAAKSQGKLTMYESEDINLKLVESRFTWLASQNAPVFPLTGKHEEKLAVVNLSEGVTFNASASSEEGNPAFNCDLQEVFVRAEQIFQILFRQGKIEENNKDEFKKRFTKAVIRDYLQTLLALGRENKLYVHKTADL